MGLLRLGGSGGGEHRAGHPLRMSRHHWLGLAVLLSCGFLHLLVHRKHPGALEATTTRSSSSSSQNMRTAWQWAAQHAIGGDSSSHEQCQASVLRNRTQRVGERLRYAGYTHAQVPCTMQTCFSHLRCASSAPPSRLRVYVYPPPDKSSDPGPSGDGYYHRHLMEFVAREPGIEVVKHPKDACVLLPPFDTTCSINTCDGARIGLELRRLPHWNRGRNHVLLHLNDATLPLFDSGEAVLLRVAGAAFTHRYGFDVQMASYKRTLHRLHDKALDSSSSSSSKKKDLLLTFQGRVYPDCANSVLGPFLSARREIVRLLDDPSRGSFLTWACYGDFKGHPIKYPGIGACEYGGASSTPTKDYVDNLLRSVFALCPAGTGPHVYRFIEILSAGAVPVVVGDEMVLPFPEDISPERWSRCVLFVPEAELTGLLDILHAISKPQLDGMRKACSELYNAYFITDDMQLRTAFRQIQSRLWFGGVAGSLSLPALPMRAEKRDVLVLHTWWEEISPADYRKAFAGRGMAAEVFDWGSFKRGPLPPDYDPPKTPVGASASSAGLWFRGFDLWSIAKYDVAVRAKMTIVQLMALLGRDPGAHADMIKEELGYAAKYVAAAESLIERHEPSALQLAQGCNLPAAAWRQVGVSRGLRIITTENTAHKDRLTWERTSGCSVISGHQLSMFFRHRDLVKPTTAREHTKKYFESVGSTKQDEHSTKGGAFRHPFITNNGRGKTVVFLGQVFTDCSILGGLYSGFDSPVDVVASLLQLTAPTSSSPSSSTPPPPPVNLIIKLHPKECAKWDHVGNLTRNHLRSHPSGDLLDAAASRSNVLIDACREYDTYEVLKAADAVVTISSQAGLEAAAMGKPVILAGRSFYSGAGFTREAHDSRELLMLLGAALAGTGFRVTEESRLAAEMFLYIYLWKAGIPRSAEAIAALHFT